MDKAMLVIGALLATVAAVRAAQKALESWRKVLEAAREENEPAQVGETNGARPREVEPVGTA